MTVHTNNPALALNERQRAERKYYIDVLKALGAPAEEARMLLPGGLKTELVMTADTKYWVEHFLPLRDADAAHPQIRLIAKEIRKYVE